MFTRRLISFLLFVFSIFHLAAQDEPANLEFIENKGQWETQVLLKADIGNGSLFLQKNGFSVLLHNPEELANIRGAHAGFIKKGHCKNSFITKRQYKKAVDITLTRVCRSISEYERSRRSYSRQATGYL